MSIKCINFKDQYAWMFNSIHPYMTGCDAMADEKAVTFNKYSEKFSHTHYEGSYLNLSTSSNPHQVKVIVWQNQQKFEMYLPVLLQEGVPLVRLSVDCDQNAVVEDEVIQFAQSIATFHFDSQPDF